MTNSRSGHIHPTALLFATVIIVFLGFVPLYAQETELVAIITYSNSSPHEIKGIRHHLTIPSDTVYQQRTGIKIRNIDKYELHQHKNNIDSYLSFELDLPPGASVKKEIIFTVKRLLPSFSYQHHITTETESSLQQYVRSSTNIESDAREIKAIAGLIAGKNTSLGEQLELAYAFPAAYLDFEPQKSTSALQAIHSGKGDCTEYAYLFVALCRNLSIPARVISGFFFGKNQTFTKPNHHATEIFLTGPGWVPVFPNLGKSRYSEEYGLGKIPRTFITLKRSDVWTWANSFPKHPQGVSKYVKATVSWEVVD
ncbi:MAG: transglutaminase-like domain-containing protein [Desulfobulbaceae bacterium]|nr:transglutaminase-like domain-containing protein [Desulfobulbaceae bacterium]